MSATNNGGPAFPGTQYAKGISPSGHSEGLSLRDYFAAKALPVAWSAYDKGYTGQPECVEQSIAHHAYQMADAMLRAREAA